MVLNNRSLGKHWVGGLTERQCKFKWRVQLLNIQKVSDTLYLLHTQLVNCGTLLDNILFLLLYSNVMCPGRYIKSDWMDMVLDFSHNHFHFKCEDT